MSIHDRMQHFRNFVERYKGRKIDKAMLKEISGELWKTGKKPLWYAFLAGVTLLILTPIITYAFFARDLTSKEKIINRKNEGVLLYDRNDKLFFSLYEAKNKTSVTLNNIPEETQKAVIAIEDKDFYNHPGFSLRGIARAFVTNLREESISQGGSTITQQLVKNALLTPDRNVLRKYQEIVLALEIDRRFKKNDILEMYLNTVYFGEGAFGIEDAAKTYFNKSAAELTLAESALLAGILPAPSAYSPLSGDKDLAFRRQKLVLKEMEAQGLITSSERSQAEVEKIVFNPQPQGNNIVAPHFALMVKEELIDKYGEQRVARSGFKVRTTLDLSLQEYAELTVQNQVARLAASKATNGAAVAMDPKTGEIVSLVGSHDWYDEENGKTNMAVRPRQPGSSFKPIVYARAIEDRIITASTQIEDKAITFPGGYKPKNYDGKFRGKVLVRYALANSLNIPAVLILEDVGVRPAIDMAERMGITTLTRPNDYGLALVLGAGEVPLIQMTNAYATFANQGVKVEPTTILEIHDKNDRVLFTHEPKTKRAMDSGVAYIISSILSDNKARAEVFGNALTISRTAAVKTGTTDDYKDAWTIGFTPNFVVGVWIGNNDNTAMNSVAGSLGAAPIWRAIMERGLSSRAVERFIKPFGVNEQLVCLENGLKAEVATSSAYPEFFLGGTVPRGTCTVPTQSPTGSATPTEEPDDEDDEDDEEPTETPTPTPTTAATPTETVTPTPTPVVINLP